MTNQEDTKPGVKTSEFWLALAVTIAGAISAVYAEAEWAQALGIVASGLASAGYSFARAQVKR